MMNCEGKTLSYTPSTAENKQTLLSKDLLDDDQQECIDRLYEHDATLLVAGLGFGKTVIAATAGSELIADGVVRKLLVVGTAKIVKNVWQEECAKWEHLQHLRVASALGTPKQRTAAVLSDADVLVISYDNLLWFLNTFTPEQHGCDGLILDEVTRMKDPGGVAFKKLRRKSKTFTWRVGMSATPVSDDYIGLYGMCLILDDGKTLGTRKDAFLRHYFYPTDYNEYNWELLDRTGQELLDKVRNLVYVVDDAEYEKSLPLPLHFTIDVDLPPEVWELYNTMAREAVIEVGGGKLGADNEAIVQGKLQQITQGFVYTDDNPDGETLHTCKLDAVRDKVLQCWETGLNVVVTYWFNWELLQLRAMFPDALELSHKNAEARWNTGKEKILLLHPSSGGHGLRLERGGHVLIRTGLQWSNDKDKQVIGRLRRKGQRFQVIVYTVMVPDSVDYIMRLRLDGKEKRSAAFKEHLKTCIKKPPG